MGGRAGHVDPTSSAVLLTGFQMVPTRHPRAPCANKDYRIKRARRLIEISPPLGALGLRNQGAQNQRIFKFCENYIRGKQLFLVICPKWAPR